MSVAERRGGLEYGEAVAIGDDVWTEFVLADIRRKKPVLCAYIFIKSCKEFMKFNQGQRSNLGWPMRTVIAKIPGP